MNEQLARSLFMDFLYDEIGEEDKKELESYLKNHPKLEAELTELRQTHALLQQMPETYPARKLAIVEPHKRTITEWWNHAKDLLPRSLLGKTGFAGAVALALLLIIGSATKMNISYSEQGFTLSLGTTPAVINGLPQNQAQMLVDRIRAENTAALSEYANMLDKSNKQQLQQVIEYFEQQRLNDLQLVSNSLEQIQKRNSDQIKQTNLVLGKVLQTVAANDR